MGERGRLADGKSQNNDEEDEASRFGDKTSRTGRSDRVPAAHNDRRRARVFLSRSPPSRMSLAIAPPRAPPRAPTPRGAPTPRRGVARVAAVAESVSGRRRRHGKTTTTTTRLAAAFALRASPLAALRPLRRRARLPSSSPNRRVATACWSLEVSLATSAAVTLCVGELLRCVLYKSFSPIARFQHLIAFPFN